MDLLKRFEEEAAEDENALLELDGNHDEDDLAHRLGSLDIGTYLLLQSRLRC
jgi:hypothetical protein